MQILGIHGVSRRSVRHKRVSTKKEDTIGHRTHVHFCRADCFCGTRYCGKKDKPGATAFDFDAQRYSNLIDCQRQSELTKRALPLSEYTTTQYTSDLYR